MYGKVIVIKRDGEDGAMFPIQQKAVTMGRTGDCDIRIQRPSVSRFQCSLEVNDRFQLMLKNLSETNPTNINGKAVKDVSPVYHQDIIQIDDRYFRIEYPPGSVFALVPRSPASSAYSRQIVGRHEQPEIFSQTPQNQIKTVKKRKSENLSTKSPNMNVNAKKRISFAPGVSPEIFDKTLPASMPIKKGSVPASPVPTRARKSLLRTPSAQKFSPLHETNAKGNRRSRSLSHSPMSANKSKISTPASEKVITTSEKRTSFVPSEQVGIENVSPKSDIASGKNSKPLAPMRNVSNKKPLSSVANNMPLNASSPFTSRNILTARRSRASTVATDSPDSSLDSITDFLTPEPSKQIKSLSTSAVKSVDDKSSEYKTPDSEKPIAKASNVSTVSPGTRKIFLARSSTTPAPRNSLRVGLLKKTIPKTQVTPKGTPQANKKENERKSVLVRKSTLMGKTIGSKNTPKAAPKSWADVAKKRLTPKPKKTGPAVVTRIVNGKIKSTVRVKRRVQSFGTELNAGKNYIFDYSSASSFASPTIIVGHQIRSKPAPKIARPFIARSVTPKVPIVKTSNVAQKKQRSPKLFPNKPQGQLATLVSKKSITPNLTGVKKLMKSPKETQSPNVKGLKELFHTKQVASPNVDVRELMRTPKEGKFPDVRGVKSLLRTPKEQKSPQLSGVKRMFKSPEEKAAKSPRLTGVAELMKSPQRKGEKTPAARQTKTAVEAKSPEVSGLKRLFSSPKRKAAKSPRLSGVAELMRTPEVMGKTPETKTIKAKETKDDAVEKGSAKSNPKKEDTVSVSPRKTRGTRRRVENKRTISPAREQVSPKKTRKTRKPDMEKAPSPKKKLESPKNSGTAKSKSLIAKSPRGESPKKVPLAAKRSRTDKNGPSPKEMETPKNPVRNAEKIIAEEFKLTPKQTRSRGARKAKSQKAISPRGESPKKRISVAAKRTRTARKADAKNDPGETSKIPSTNAKIQKVESLSTPKKTRSRVTTNVTSSPKSNYVQELTQIVVVNSPKKTRSTRNTKQQNAQPNELSKSVEVKPSPVKVHYAEKVVTKEKTNASPKSRNTRKRVQEGVEMPSPKKVSESPTPTKTRHAKESKTKDSRRESSPKKPETPKKARSARTKVGKLDVEVPKTRAVEKRETQKSPKISMKAKYSGTVKKEVPVIDLIDAVSPRKTRGKANEQPKQVAKTSARATVTDVTTSLKRTRGAPTIEILENSPKKPEIAAIEKVTVKVSPKKTRSAKATTKIDTPVKKTATDKNSPKVTRSLRSRKQ